MIILSTFLALLIIIITGFILYTKHVRSFNSSEKVEIASTEKSKLFSFYPREAETDSWTKYVTDGKNNRILYRGTIYEAVIRNSTEYTITDWKIRINIHNFCYLNNAWCGTFEIHQFVDGIENVQLLDLQNYSRNDIILDYLMSDNDLLIPLNEGDYLIYYPNEQVNETPITSLQVSDSEVKIGVIFYTYDNSLMKLDDISMHYYMEKDLLQGTAFKVLISALLLWWIAVITTVAVNVSVTISRRRLEQKDEIIYQAIRVFTRFFDAKDEYTYGHSQRVAKYSSMIAAKLGYSHDECRNVYYIALMHDCGKCYIPDTILKKPGRLTENEYQSIKNHTIQGAEMLKDFTAIEGIADGAMYHHERFDGGGYPTGKKGEEIPMIGRIICVADAFDAMNSRRCYRKELSKEYIINEIVLNKGKQFDPKVVDCILELIQEKKIQFGMEEV